MSRDARRRQLLDMALEIVRAEGTDALTLAELAERAGVTKPIAYDHFGTREGLLMALYGHFDERQSAAAADALATRAKSLKDAAQILAAAYVDCLVQSGPEYAAVSAALAGNPDMEAFRRQLREGYVAQYRAGLKPFVKVSDKDVFTGIIGAADALAEAAASGAMTRDRAVETLSAIILGALSDK